jgi:hypothetical protein
MRTHPTRLVLVAALFAPVVAAQNPRPSTQVDTNFVGIGVGPAVHSSGDRTAVLFNDTASNEVSVVTSDGRGLVWSAPVRVDDDMTGADKFTGNQFGNPTVFVSGSNVYATWLDERNGSNVNDVFFDRSTDGGATWGTDVLLDKNYAPGGNPVRNWTMAVSPDPGGDHIYVLISVDNGPEELYLVASHDSGVTFSSAVAVSTANGTGADVDQIGLCAEGLTVHVVWSDDRAGNASFDDVFYRQSTDGGATFGSEIQLDASGALAGDVEFDTLVACSFPTVAVAWQEELASASNEEVHVRISTDGGAIFAGPDMVVGGYTAGTDDTDSIALAISGSRVLVGWDDNRTGADEVWVATTTDGGVTYTADVQLSTTGEGGGFPHFAGAGDDVVAIWTTDALFPQQTDSAFSRDGGLTWTTDVTASDTAGDSDFAEIAYNELYGNAHAVWLADDLGSNNVYAGGYRPQTLDPVGIAAGGMGSFALTHFDPAPPRFCWVFLANTPGNLPLVAFGDPRNLGLALSPLFLTSLANPVFFLTTLDAAGNGATMPQTIPAPMGFTFFAAAVSFTVAPIVLRELTDVQTIVVQ